MSRSVKRLVWDFDGQLAFPAVGSGVGAPWCKNLTGTPTVAGAAGGGTALTLAATNEAENANLYFGDVLSLSLPDLKSIEFWASLPVALGTASALAFGLATARNADPDAITSRAMFRIAAGLAAVTCETDNNAVDSGKIASGHSLGTGLRHFRIEFAEATLGLADVRFFMDNSRGQLRRVAQTTTPFSMVGVTNVQPLLQIQKTATTDLGTFLIRRVEAEVRMAA